MLVISWLPSVCIQQYEPRKAYRMTRLNFRQKAVGSMQTKNISLNEFSVHSRSKFPKRGNNKLKLFPRAVALSISRPDLLTD